MKRFALKRLTALALALIMTLSLLPMNVWAEELQENAEEQVIVAAEEKEESPAEVAEEPAEDSSAVVEESAEEPVVEEETESSEPEDVSASAGVSAPLANSAASTTEARWGEAGTNGALPTEWTEGALSAAEIYANSLEDGTAYIQLLKDVDTTEPLFFDVDTTAILDLNGHTIDRGLSEYTEDGNVITVIGALTLCDSSSDDATEQGCITGGYNDADGGAVYVECGTFVMEGGIICGNTANYGGAVAAILGEFAMTGGSISNNTADFGGGVYADYESTVSMNGGSISNNTAVDEYASGGGIFICDSNLTMTGGTISENDATYGGGVYFESGSFSVSGEPVINNNTSNNVYVEDGCTITVGALGSGTSIGVTMDVISDPITSGGAVYADSGYFFSDNENYIVAANGNNLKLVAPSARWGLATGTNSDELPTIWNYGALAEAMTYANGLESGTAYIQLLKGVDTTALIEFASGKTTILDLNGFDIDRGLTKATSYGSVIYVWGNLTLCDTSENAETDPGKITGGYTNDGIGGVYVASGSTFTMEGGSISGNTAKGFGGGVHVDSGGTFTMKDGSISGNTANASGGGVFVYFGSTFTMEGGSISDNTAKGSGGGVYASGPFTMKDGSISGNTANASGGGVYVDYYNDYTFTMEGGSISDNTTNAEGGGVYVGNDSTFTMKDGSISGNTAHYSDGGGVYVDKRCTFTMENGSISDNTAKYGGGVYASGRFTMKGGSISGNTADDGGGVYFKGGSFSVSGEPVINNNTSNNVYVEYGCAISVGRLGSNTSIGVTMDVISDPITSGGAVYADSGYFFSDDEDYIVAASGNNLKLVAPSARWGLATGTNNDECPATWKYGTLVKAMTYANGLESGTAYIQLLKGVDTTAPLEFAEGKTTILDLNGKTIDRGLTAATSNGSVIYVYGDLTLCDTSTNATTAPGKITGGYSDYSGGGVSVCQDGAFTMTGGAIVENHAACDGGGVHLRASSFAMTGGTVAENTAAMGGGVFVTDEFWYEPDNTLVFKRGAFVMTGGTISENTATSVSNDYSFNYGGYGGGVYLEGSDFTITNGTISNNTASDAGGGVFVGGYHYGEVEHSAFEISGTPVISGNTVGANANNVYLTSDEIITVGTLASGVSVGVTMISRTGGTFTSGGAEYADDGYFISDNANYVVAADGNNLKLAVPGEDEPPVVGLGITSGSMNLFQETALTVPVECNYEFVGARFKDPAVSAVFDISLGENGTIQITPKDKPEDVPWAEWGKEVAGSYKSAVEIEYIRGQYVTTSEMLTINLTATAPKVTAGAVKFNSFLAGDTQQLAFTVKDAVVESVAVNADKDNPTWVTLTDDRTLTLVNENLENSKGSGKMNLLVMLEGYRAPAEVVVSVSAAYSAPKLKLSASSVSLLGKSDYQEPVELALLSGDKNFDINKVTHLTVDNDGYIVEYLGGGKFTLDTAKNPVSGKINLIATVAGGANTITVPLTVKVVAPTVKANPAKVTLNPVMHNSGKGLFDAQSVVLSASMDGAWLSADNVSWKIYDKSGKEELPDSTLNFEYDAETTTLTIGTVDGMTAATYKVKVIVGGVAKTTDITVTVKETLPKLKLNKSSITLNTAMGDNADVQTVTVTDSDVNYDFVLLQEEVTAPDGISAVVGENNAIAVSALTETANGSYKVEIEHKMPGGQSVKSTLTVKVAAKLPTLKPDNKTLSLDKIHGIGTVNVDGLAGFGVGELIAEPTVEGITVEMIDRDSFTVKIDESLDKKGGKINVSFKLSETTATKPVAITVKPVDKITATATVKGNMDMTRPDTTSSNFTFKYTGWYPGEYGDAAYEPTLVWEVYAMNGKNKIAGHEEYEFVIGKGSLVASSNDNNGGWFCDVDDTDYGVSLALNTDEVGAWKNGAVNPKYTYTVETKLVFADGTEAVCKSVKLTVKQGSVKFAADTKAVTVAKQQDAESVTFAINGTDKDKLLVADIAKVEVAASKNPRAFTVIESGDGYAIKVVNPAIAKSGTVKLNIWLEGNYVDGCEEILDTKSTYYRKPNATVSLKVTVQ